MRQVARLRALLVTTVTGVALALAGSPVGVVAGQTFRAATTGVRIDAWVTRGHIPVPDLHAEDFSLTDNGVPQQLEVRMGNSEALDGVLLFDVSDSLSGGPLDALKAAARELLDQLRDGDRAALLTFGTRAALRVPLTDDRDAIRRNLDALVPGGATALADGVFLGLAQREDAPRRCLLLVFSDGRDNSSWLSTSDVVEAITASEVVVYTVAFHPASATRLSLRGPTSLVALTDNEGPDMSLLDAMAEKSGGLSLVAQEPREFPGLFARVIREMRLRYLITYTPTGVREGGWHDVKIRLRKRAGEVRARAGYWGTSTQRRNEDGKND